MTSPNGSTWTERTTPDGTSTWQSVAWSPELGLFIAVADTGDNSIMSSADGITWTARTAPEDNAWKSVVWSPERSLFVAVAGSGTNRVMTSPDGTTWTARAASEANTWMSVAWSPEQSLFVAVSSDGTNRVMTSSDGITWTARSASAANAWNAVTWSPVLGMFVAVAGSGTNRVMTSPDGITWTGQDASMDNTWNAVTWSPDVNVLVAVASTGGSGVGTPRVMTGAIATSTTNTATNIGTTSATLNGDYQDNFIGSGVSAFFRYRVAGSGDSYTETAPQAIASAGSFNADITGLTSGNTTYEFKAVLQWSGASGTQTLEGGLQTLTTDSEDTDSEEEEDEDSSPRSRAGGSIHYGCKDLNAVNYEYFSRHKQELCKYATDLTPVLTTPTPNSCPTYTFTRNLRQGMEGEDVRSLQKLLNCLGFNLAESGPGAPGEETSLFRALTHAAVVRFQERYAADILTPLNLTSGTGYFAEMTRRKMEAVVGGG